MQVEKIPQEFMVALPLLQQIRAAGFEAYFVGGSVRDTILGLPIHDVDIATSAYPAEIKAIFERTVDTGIEHGTVMVLTMVKVTRSRLFGQKVAIKIFGDLIKSSLSVL